MLGEVNELVFKIRTEPESAGLVAKLGGYATIRSGPASFADA